MITDDQICFHCGVRGGLHALTCQKRDYRPSALAQSISQQPEHEQADSIKRIQRTFGLSFATRVSDRLKQIKGSN